MFTVFRQTIKDIRLVTLIYCLSAIIVLWMYIALFPQIRDQSASLSQLLASYPEGLMQAFGIQDTDFTLLGNFLSMEYFSFIWPLLAMFFSISVAGNLISGEIETGTMELNLAQPVSRTQLFLGRYSASLVMGALFCLCSILAVVPLAKIYSVDTNLSGLYRMTILGFLAFWTISSGAFLASAFFSEKGKTYFVMAGLLIVMYVINILSVLRPSLEKLHYTSLFYYLDSHAALVKDQILSGAYLAFGLVIVVSFLLALWRFQKRDIAN